MRGRRGWAAVLLAGVAGVATVGPVLWLTAAPAGAFTAGVTINDKPKPDPKGAGVFNQPVTPIHVNDRVLWTNKTQNKHTVTSDPGSLSFDSGDIPGGGQYELRFSTAGTYTYHCTIHPSMVGRIEVTDPSATTTTTAPAPPPTTTTAPAPPPTTAPPAPPTTAAPTTTTGPPRPPAAVPPPAPPVPNSAPAPPPLASSSTTTVPSTTTTTVPPTTATSAPPVLAGGEGGPPSSAPAPPPTTAAPNAGDNGGKIPIAAGPPAGSGGHLDVTATALVAALVAVGAFGLWTLIRFRPGHI